MKLTFTSILVLSVLFTFETLHAQVAAGYEVATWFQFKKAAVTYTFDDNTASQLTVAVPLFDQYDYKVTLFTVINWSPNWSGLLAASGKGHEIGSHTVSHTPLSTLTAEKQQPELEQSKNSINSNITNAKCLTIAYPNCLMGDRAEIASRYIAGRTCQGTIESSTPADYYGISSIVCGAEGSVKTADDFNARVLSAKDSKGWCVFLIHAINSDEGFSALSSTVISSHLAYMNTNKADYWVSTFGKVVKYIKERNAVSVTGLVIDNRSYKVTITDNLDNAIYNTPLTIKSELPADWSDAKVFKGGTEIEYSISSVSNKKYVTFNAIPDQGDILIAKPGGVVTALEEPTKPSLKIQSTIFTHEAIINVEGNFSYSIISIEGKVLETGNAKNTLSIGRDLGKGMYILRLRRGAELSMTKIIKR